MSDTDKDYLLRVLTDWRDESLERIRKELDAAKQANAELRRELDEAYERAAICCETEEVEITDPTDPNEGDVAYNLACGHCASSIRLLKSTATKREG